MTKPTINGVEDSEGGLGDGRDNRWVSQKVPVDYYPGLAQVDSTMISTHGNDFFLPNGDRPGNLDWTRPNIFGHDVIDLTVEGANAHAYKEKRERGNQNLGKLVIPILRCADYRFERFRDIIMDLRQDPNSRSIPQRDPNLISFENVPLRVDVVFAPGELVFSDKGNILIYGNKNKIGSTNFYDAIQEARDQGAIVGIDKPLLEFNSMARRQYDFLNRVQNAGVGRQDLEKVIDNIDFIGLNGLWIGMFGEGLESATRQAALEYGKPLMANSNAKRPNELFESYAEFPSLDTTSLDSLNASMRNQLEMRQGTYSLEQKGKLTSNYRAIRELLIGRSIHGKLRSSPPKLIRDNSSYELQN